ncbi:MAG: hypothetical protein UY05_C0053G0003 [Candidatus Peregrinibacteria bacterium GW2011_GWA2_47_7]|nr:MAG: hypothetical protein UY05_C0053G0003 [Candidatus Peregrinibacteria bacterium GW2011_GWA2_47_7]
MTCTHCKKDFQITEDDISFYTLFDVPEPRQCPQCRLVRRLLERNAKSLCYRTCDLTKEKTLSQYHQDQPFPVYKPSAWWSDEWDGRTYGRDFDFNRPFFEQFLELKKKVPHCALFNTEGTMQNSDFNNCTAYIKNCYLIAESDYCEDCYYSNLLKKCTNIVDCSVTYDSELCYECVNCTNCYALRYSKDCQQCKDSFFLENCASCSNCIGCINQRHKGYMIFNVQYSTEEYKEKLKEFHLDTQEGIEALRQKCQEFFLTQPHKAILAEQNENCVGDQLFNSKNAYYCFDSRDLEDCRYCAKLTLRVKSSMDYTSWGNQSELMYQCMGCGDQNYNLKFCVMCQKDMRNCEYCYECFSCADCFGCVGLKSKKYCILNKQYTKEEYEKLRARVIEHMKKGRVHSTSAQASEVGSRGSQLSEAELTNQEYGEFFPVGVGAFAYNESIAMDVYPLTKEETLAQGYPWRDEKTKSPRPQTYEVPKLIKDVKDDITNEVLACENCSKNYKIIPQELKFYIQIGIPIPLKCSSCRHRSRMLRRNPPQLWPRTCAHCGTETLTSYAPDRPEIVYCEKCYLEAVY